MTYERIAEYYNTKGIKISQMALYRRCKKIYKEKGKEDPKIKKGKNKREDVTDEEIYELREQGKSYEEIARYYNEKGIQIGQTTIRKICRKIYKEKGQEEPKAKKGRKVKNDITDEEIYELREQGESYEEIARYYNEKGIEISKATIAYRCKKIYNAKGKEDPKIKKGKNKREDVTDEEIYELREQGKSYEEIARYYKEKGIEITRVTIGKRCKKIYNEKGKEEPKIKRKNMIKEATDEEIYELREQGMSYGDIVRYYNEKGIQIGQNTIAYRCKKIYNEKGKEEPKAKKGEKERNDITDEEIYELREQGMTHKEIAKHFNNKGIPITRVTIGKKCKEVYKEKGEEEPKAKRGRKKNNNTKLLGNLNNTLNKRIKEKIGTEKELAELKYKEKNTEGAEK